MIRSTGYQIVQEIRRPSRRFWRKDVFFVLSLLAVGLAAGFAAERGVGPAPIEGAERPLFEAVHAPSNDGSA